MSYSFTIYGHGDILVMWSHDQLNKFMIPILLECCKWNLIETGSAVSTEKLSENVDKHSILVTSGQGHRMTWTSGIQTGSWHPYFHITDYHCFGKRQCFTSSPFKIPRDQICPWRKMGQGHPRVTIWTSLVELGHFQRFMRRFFLRFVPYMDMAAILLIRSGPFDQIFNQPLPGGCIWNLIKIGPAVSENKSFENINKHSIQGIQRGAWSTLLHITDYHCFGKRQCFTFSPFKIPMDQSQPKVTIWTNLVVLGHLMLHTKFQGNQPNGSGEDDVFRFLPYMAILVRRPGPFEHILYLVLPGCCIWNLTEISLVVSEKLCEKADNADDTDNADDGPLSIQ